MDGRIWMVTKGKRIMKKYTLVAYKESMGDRCSQLEITNELNYEELINKCGSYVKLLDYDEYPFTFTILVNDLCVFDDNYSSMKINYDSVYICELKDKITKDILNIQETKIEELQKDREIKMKNELEKCRVKNIEREKELLSELKKKYE